MSTLRLREYSNMDEELARKCVLKENWAISALVRKYSPDFEQHTHAALRKRRADLYINNISIAIDEIVQNSWMAVFRRDCDVLATYDSSRGKGLRGYLLQIVFREANNYLNRLTSLKRGGAFGEVLYDPLEFSYDTGSALANNAENQMIFSQLWDELSSRVLARLTKRNQEVYHLRFELDWEANEVAAELEMSLTSVYNRTHCIRVVIACVAHDMGLTDKASLDKYLHGNVQASA